MPGRQTGDKGTGYYLDVVSLARKAAKKTAASSGAPRVTPRRAADWRALPSSKLEERFLCCRSQAQGARKRAQRQDGGGAGLGPEDNRHQ